MRSFFRTLAVLLKYSNRSGRNAIVLASAASIIAGVAGAALVAVISSILSGKVVSMQRSAWIFCLLCLCVPIANSCAAFTLMRLTASAAQDLRKQLARAILASSYQVLEDIGSPRIVATLTEDIPSLRDAITDMPYLLSQIAIMLSCLTYLGFLSWRLLPILIIYMLLGVALQQFWMRKARRCWKALREAWDSMFGAIRALTDGAKELKLHQKRREEFLVRQVDRSAEEIFRNEVRAGIFVVSAAQGGQSMFYVFIGLVLFAAPSVVYLDHRAATGYVLTILFMMTPLTIILNALPRLGRANVAANKIDSLGLSLTESPVERAATDQPGQMADWSKLELIDVVHTYLHDDIGHEFSLGPINLTLYRGELLFIVGGNGSVKTTLTKILVGLYEPHRGEVRMDSDLIDLTNRDTYRQMFSVVFDDPYLFPELFGIGSQEINQKASGYLRDLQLNHKVDVVDGKLSTISLSRGQRKRLALLTAYLEDRPIYVFDEWASDQDPIFKQTFYLDILPELKARGKTAIVITHDDRYYSVADRVIKLERGRVESDHRVTSGGTPLEESSLPTRVS